MKITVRYKDSDHLELLRLINYDKRNVKLSKILYKILIPMLIMITIALMWNNIYPYTLPTIIIGALLIILWIIFSDAIYYRQLDIALKGLVKEQYSASIEYLKDTTITLTDEAIIKEVEGSYAKYNWSLVDKIFVTDSHIFIQINVGAFIIIPLNFFYNKKEQETFLKFIDSHINISFKGLEM